MYDNSTSLLCQAIKTFTRLCKEGLLFSIMDSKHDEALMHILRESKNVANFLDTVFGFLYRCTDFYEECPKNSVQKIGFARKETDILVASTLNRWKDRALNSSRKRKLFVDNCKANENNAECLNSTKGSKKSMPRSNSDNADPSSKSFDADHTADSYNGAVRDNYVWTQTLTDLDVLVNVPEYVKSPGFLKVNISSDEIEIDVQSSDSEDFIWKNLFTGKLSFKIRKDESMWSIVPGKQISIHLEKATETWWDALIVNEPKIDLRQIDCSKNFNDMTPEEQMKVQELMWNHQQKILDNETTDEKRNRESIEATLKKAWDAERSPFQGKPYDPSILKFN